MQADVEDFTDGQIFSTCQELLTCCRRKEDSHEHGGLTCPTRTGGTGSLSMPPPWRHVGEQLVHAELWATIHQL